MYSLLFSNFLVFNLLTLQCMCLCVLFNIWSFYDFIKQKKYEAFMRQNFMTTTYFFFFLFLVNSMTTTWTDLKKFPWSKIEFETHTYLCIFVFVLCTTSSFLLFCSHFNTLNLIFFRQISKVPQSFIRFFKPYIYNKFPLFIYLFLKWVSYVIDL